MNIDVLCVGMAAYDITYFVNRHPGDDEKMSAEQLFQCGGGPAANASIAASRLGGRAAFVGYLGNDIFGNLILDEFKENNVLVNFVERGAKPTSLSVVIVKPDGKRSVVNYRERCSLRISADEILGETAPRVILFDGHEMELSLVLAEKARKKGIKLILDAGSAHDGTLSLLDRVDYVVCSETFMRQFAPERELFDGLNLLLQSCPVVVITMGSQGLIWGYEGKQGSLPAYNVSVVDTTGAGDVFHGALALSIAEGKTFPESLRFASASAALSCTKPTARNSAPSLREVEKFLERHQRSTW